MDIILTFVSTIVTFLKQYFPYKTFYTTFLQFCVNTLNTFSCPQMLVTGRFPKLTSAALSNFTSVIKKKLFDLFDFVICISHRIKE